MNNVRACSSLGVGVDKNKGAHNLSTLVGAENGDAITWRGLFIVTDDGGDGDIEEEEGGDELGSESSVK